MTAYLVNILVQALQSMSDENKKDTTAQSSWAFWAKQLLMKVSFHPVIDLVCGHSCQQVAGQGCIFAGESISLLHGAGRLWRV